MLFRQALIFAGKVKKGQKALGSISVGNQSDAIQAAGNHPLFPSALTTKLGILTIFPTAWARPPSSEQSGETMNFPLPRGDRPLGERWILSFSSHVPGKAFFFPMAFPPRTSEQAPGGGGHWNAQKTNRNNTKNFPSCSNSDSGEGASAASPGSAPPTVPKPVSPARTTARRP